MGEIIHIATDEKFINNANWLFEEAFPEKNKFFILVADLDKSLTHVSEQNNVTKIGQDPKLLKSLAQKIEKNTTVVLHGLFYHASIFVNSLNPKVKTVWILFGKEFHENPKFKMQSSLYGPITTDLLNGNTFYNKFVRHLKNYLRDFVYIIKNSTLGPFTQIQIASKRVDYFGILYKEEFDHIADVIQNEDLKFFKFSYYPIERMVDNINTKVKGSNILLGNSANSSGNHLEAFDILKTRGIGERKIICPLSYGDARYAEIIKQHGVALFKHNFVPLIEFMPLHQYNSYLEQCGIVIMNNYRQQAVGNIMTMLWMGAKVFLDKRNTTYNYLKRITVHVFSIESDLNNLDAFDLLSDEQIMHNRSIIISEIGQQQLQQDLKRVSDIFIS